VGLQPLLTSTIANRLLGERVAARQWVGLILGLLGIYLVVQGQGDDRRDYTAGLGSCNSSPKQHYVRHHLSEAFRRRYRLAARQDGADEHRPAQPVLRIE
jgi:hypothetical protein